MTTLEDNYHIVGINVKSTALYRDLPNIIRTAVEDDKITEQQLTSWSEPISEGLAAYFWETAAPALAEEHGFDGVESYGRSSGWLVPTIGGYSLTEEQITEDSVNCPDCHPYDDDLTDPDCETCAAQGMVPNPWKGRFEALKADLDREIEHLEQQLGEALVERLKEFLTGQCANCAQEHGPIDVCLLGAVAGVVQGRDNVLTVTPQILANIDMNSFWDRVGPVIDWLEEQIRAQEAESCE